MADESTHDYFDSIATFYDAKYRDQEVGDRDFYLETAHEADGPVLEVAVGTGRIYLELLREGIDADGFDISENMLDVLRKKAADADLEPSVWQADMTEFETDREYDLVIVPFRAFLHLIDLEDQLAALDRFHGTLAPGGELVISSFVPNFEVICETYGEWTDETFERDGERYTVRSKQEIIDEVDQMMWEHQQYYDGDGELIDSAEFRLKLITKREFELLFRASPFSEWTVRGGFDGEDLESWDQEMVWTATR
ncbi:MAG: class I SAM-dependent methyltransferase [archaeon]